MNDLRGPDGQSADEWANRYAVALRTLFPGEANSDYRSLVEDGFSRGTRVKMLPLLKLPNERESEPEIDAAVAVVKAVDKLALDPPFRRAVDEATLKLF